MVFVKTGKNAIHVVEQCAWALGNVAGEGEDLLDVLLRQGALPPLARHLASSQLTLARTAAWALSNIIKVILPQLSISIRESYIWHFKIF